MWIRLGDHPLVQVDIQAEGAKGPLTLICQIQDINQTTDQNKKLKILNQMMDITQKWPGNG